MTDSLVLRLRLAAPRLYRVYWSQITYAAPESQQQMLLLDFDLAGVREQLIGDELQFASREKHFYRAVPANPEALTKDERWELHRRYPDWFDSPFKDENDNADESGAEETS